MYRGFPKKLVSVLLCPRDGSPFFYDGGDVYISDGILRCKECAQECHVKEGIVHFLPIQDSSYAQNEVRARDAEALTYDNRLKPRYYREVVPTCRAMGNPSKKRIIEYACGTGRLTREVEDTYESYLALDFSLESLIVLKNSLMHRGDIGLIWGDAVHIETSKGYFDIALSSQFLEHVEGVEDQRRFLDNVHSTLGSGGACLVSVYYYDLRRRLKSMPQEGVHGNGIYYHYFSRSEIQELFKDFFDNITVSFIDIMLPLEARLGFSDRVEGFFSEILRRIPFLRQFAHLLLIEAKNPHNE